VTRASGNAGRRERAEKARENVVKVRLSDEEMAALGAAAGRAGMALAAWLGQLGMDAADHRAVPVPVLQQETLNELIRASELVRRVGVNVNQAVARLNATGEPGMDLGPALAYCMRVVARVDEAARLIRRGLR